jgi:hypothetical protein
VPAREKRRRCNLAWPERKTKGKRCKLRGGVKQEGREAGPLYLAGRVRAAWGILPHDTIVTGGK